MVKYLQIAALCMLFNCMNGISALAAELNENENIDFIDLFGGSLEPLDSPILWEEVHGIEPVRAKSSALDQENETTGPLIEVTNTFERGNFKATVVSKITFPSEKENDRSSLAKKSKSMKASRRLQSKRRSDFLKIDLSQALFNFSGSNNSSDDKADTGLDEFWLPALEDKAGVSGRSFDFLRNQRLVYADSSQNSASFLVWLACVEVLGEVFYSDLNHMIMMLSRNIKINGKISDFEELRTELKQLAAQIDKDSVYLLIKGEVERKFRLSIEGEVRSNVFSSFHSDLAKYFKNGVLAKEHSDEFLKVLAGSMHSVLETYYDCLLHMLFDAQDNSLESNYDFFPAVKESFYSYLINLYAFSVDFIDFSIFDENSFKFILNPDLSDTLFLRNLAYPFLIVINELHSL